MIVKKTEMSLKLQKLLALRRRTPPTHPKLPLIKEHVAKGLAGYRGECAVDYQLTLLPEKSFYSFHDIRLFDSKHYFQIDHLLLLKKFALILEVKNIAGILEFDEDNHQLIRTLGTQKDGFSDPLLQVYFKELHFKKWLALHSVTELPVLSLVVTSHSNSILQTTSPKVIRNEFLPIKIMQLEKSFQGPSFNDKSLKKIIRLIKKHHTPLNPAILEQYEVFEEQLLKGIFCPKCESFSVVRIHGGWKCSSCLHKCKDAHIPSIKDYSLLIKEEFTNRELQNFLLIPNPYLINRLLHASDFASKGVTKAQIYRFLN